jgi:hypothetical protein
MAETLYQKLDNCDYIHSFLDKSELKNLDIELKRRSESCQIEIFKEYKDNPYVKAAIERKENIKLALENLIKSDKGILNYLNKDFKKRKKEIQELLWYPSLEQAEYLDNKIQEIYLNGKNE